MRSRAPLALLEQVLMLLVFAIAAVICLQAFVRSDIASRHGAARDEALTVAQSAAEILKSTRGDLHKTAQQLGGTVTAEGWVMEGEHFHLTAVITQRTALLGRATITVTAADTVEGTLSVAWQEVVP
ncbi:MAG: hypothetical protein IJA33_02995 [Oscillospiraceae bacterium]|nr:hypothetical protein [Oscillospiraceae bacterium]